jgi:branched-chain amino acid transport system permease protein
VNRTLGELRRAARDARRAWSNESWLAAAALLAAAVLVPLGPFELDRLAGWLYLALGAVGLVYAVGLAGLPSLGQGALMGIGAFAAALLRARADWPLLPSVVVAVVVAAAAGLLAGLGIARLRPAFVAVSTWILAWLVALALAAFPWLSGGAQGLLVTPSLSAGQHYELALGLVALAALGAFALRKAAFGLRLSAARQRPAAAAALGVRAPRLRLGAFVAAAAIAGLAGALAVDLDGVADPTAFGPFLSFELFVAALIGGASASLGPVAGLACLWLVTSAAHAVGAFDDASSGRFDPMLAGILLLAVLTAGGSGLVPALRARLPRRPSPAPAERTRPSPSGPATLVAERLTKRFGSLDAVAELDLTVEPGSIVALVGPNGSGKTTALRLLAGALRADEGRVLLDEDELDGLPMAERVERGLVRTIQATATFPELTALENVLVGVPRRHGGGVRALVATPLSRVSEAEARAVALGALDRFGLAGEALRPAGELASFEQRVLMLAAAWATSPRVLLLDEPAAGASAADLERLAALLDGLRVDGIGVLLVEHNLRLVRRVADRVVVLAAGSAVASGPPDEVGRDPAVQAVYLGARRL